MKFIAYQNMFRWTAALMLLIASQTFIIAQQKLIPLNNFYSQEIERAALRDSSSDLHSASRPYLENHIDFENVYGLRKDTTKIYSKEAGKILKHHLFSIRKDDFFLALDPLFDFTLGKDISDTTYFKTQKMYTNQRGAQLIGDIGKKFSFQTSFYETQIVVPVYLKEYCDSTGIFPGFGRTKDFNQRGYDFGMSNGWLSYSPIEKLNIQFGNGKSFYGHGYRSLLWSDAAFSFPYVKATTTLWGGRLQYSSMYAVLQSLQRLPRGEVPESLFARKGATVNYLSIIPVDGVEIGLFESVIWVKFDSTGTRALPPSAYVPVIGVNTSIFGFNNSNNVLTGLNLKIKLSRHACFYGQAAIDDLRNGKQATAFQAGLKFYDLLIPNLDLQIEANRLSNNMYASHEQLQSYTHANQPLGHPTGPGTDELLLIGNYRFRRYCVHVRVNQIYHNLGPQGNWKNDPEVLFTNVAPWPERSTTQVSFQTGFIFNPKTNFQILGGCTYRRDRTDFNWSEDTGRTTTLLYLTLRTNLINRYDDF